MKKRSIMMVLLAASIGLYGQEGKAKDSTKTANIQEVVITSLGIKRQARSLTYSAQQIGGDDLTEVKTPNLLNSINGKVSNVQINKTNGGVGGSVRIVMRGDKSTRNSQPLFVIDGIPIVNNTGGPNVDYFAGMPDTGDIMSTINPEDIQSINFLKGASAAALYGAQGSNGAILITTKKGAAGKSALSFSSSLTFDQVYALPKFQNSYLQTIPYNPQTGETGSAQSWGAKGTSKDYTKSFYDTGTTWTNSLTFTSGNEKSTNFFSLGNTTNKGVIPTSTFEQYNASFRNSSKFLDDKLTLDANLMGSLQDSKNRLTPGSYFSPIANLYWLPRGIDLDNFRDNYSYFNKERYLPAQNWWAIKPDGSFSVESQNPYWILNRNPVTTKNKNFYGSAALSYAINDWLTAKIRGNYNWYQSDSERDVSVYSLPVVLGGNNNGKIYKNTIDRTTKYGDFILLGSPHINDNISLDFTVGASISDVKVSTTNIENNMFAKANVFALNNLIWSGQNGDGQSYTIYNTRRQDQSVFASTTLGYKKLVYADFTFRNDWSSTLAGTGNNGFDYESVGLNAILSDILTLPKAINFWKVRGSYATVGNALDPTYTMPQYLFNAGAILGTYSSSPVTNPEFKDLFPKPELNRTFEVGTEMRFMKNRLTFDFTYYNSNVSNQYLVGVDAVANFGAATGKVDINAGKIQNTGFEASLSYDIFKEASFGWTATLNASSNRNKIKELLPTKYYSNTAIPFSLVGGGYNKLVLGGSFGDIYGVAFKRDNQGRILVDKDGVPLRTDTNLNYLGNPNPKFILGLNNSFSIGKLKVDFLIDGKFGGKVLGITQATLDANGVSKVTADARDAGGVTIPNAAYENGTAYTGKTDASKYYTAVGGRSPIDEAYVYNATTIRLRQASLAYTFKTNTKYLRDATVSVIGTNLFFFYKKAPFDPEQVSGVNPGGVGIDMLGMPITRSIGFSVKLNF
ncbi:SusC/RagA family TonB-linked outer membrane protein [Elizabethkingia anophelis]|uniref:TonB-linked outer membrane protein, SusC/RagA family n=2 Tax=Elizabethkingia anophelis TaxID=1117645 RepID=A0A7Z7LW46_9FLAO|nr:SusC/RagA family TonB-linked outer membrane protein [Elizabethkingia anophelis]MCL1642001.1 SusC/RagA family TonB-linked outer membrane protein [Elizabethkingia anophelis]MCL1644547.1 SusC/RagA family TonB-linked outer membrane protein [Elizabethkingia anophelis]MCW2464991.1 TonB-linked SusC/RagA family outer membrane protein [Elizabethkingia anophelis]MCW2468674.1 TonB-linked SusC/RagA family outer membrane protein [Elizabethkingia anophelis]MCW2472358.1 TonB-linked SusC/RagA family outer 